MKTVGKEQAGAIAVEMRRNEEQRKIRARRRKKLQYKILCWSMSILAVLYIIWLVWAVVQIRIDTNPELGRCLLPKGTWGYQQYNNLKWIDCELP
jgi:predicted anti-sigma-YlaC factor YlaD